MRLVLINANREQFPDPIFPLGAAYVAGACRSQGHEVVPLDLCFESDSERALVHAIIQDRPDAVAFSFRNLDNAAYPLTRHYLDESSRLISIAREHTKAPIIAGGSAYSLMPEILLPQLGADYGISGEGEIALPLLLDALDAGKDPASVPGVFVRDGDHVTPGPPSRAWFSSGPYALAGLPSPARDLWKYRRYSRRGGMGNIQTKRGCVFKCRYCTYPLLEGNKIRMRPPSDVADEMQDLIERFGERYLFIVDSVFNSPPQHAEAICDEILKRNLRISWTCYASPAFLNESVVRKMAAAGCRGVEIGSDSAENGMLREWGKSFTADQVVRATQWCRHAGINTCHTLIFGGPGETPESVRETCRAIDTCRPTAVVAMAGVRVYPGTPLAAACEADGVLPAGQSYSDPVFYIAPEVRDFLFPFLESFARARGNWVLPGLVPPVEPITQRLIRAIGYKPPLWHLLRYGVFKDRIYRDR